jgi:polysaccharide export outer membrane protein
MVVALIALLISSPEAFCQQRRGPGAYSNSRGFGEVSQKRNTSAKLRISKISTDYLLGPGDELNIEIIGQGALTQSLQSIKISNSGEISIPFLGTLAAADITAAELESKIASQLKEKQLVKDPEVLVYVNNYQSKPFYVLGKVDNPGEYVMTQQLTLSEAIFMAGGIDIIEAGSRGAERFGFLHRRLSADSPEWKPVASSAISNPDVARPGREVIKVDLEPLMKGGVLNPDIVLRKGDVIVVPERQTEYILVIGDVRVPGAYNITYPTMQVSQAIIKAGGPGAKAKADKGILIRYGNDGKREERHVDFYGILKGKRPDFEVRPNDILFVPGSFAKSLGQGFLGILPTTVERQVYETIGDK